MEKDIATLDAVTDLSSTSQLLLILANKNGAPLEIAKNSVTLCCICEKLI